MKEWAEKQVSKRPLRPEQRPPDGDWLIWLILAGRGWGKTYVGAAWLAEMAMAVPDSEWAIIAPKFSDARSVCLESDVGFLKALPPGALKSYNRTNLEIRLSSGAVIFCYGAEDPRVGVRGRNLSGCWADELALWHYREVWDEGLMFALRDSVHPRIVATTTPRPVGLITELLGRQDGTVVVTRGSTFDNAANLSPAFLEEIHRRYEGTRLGRQELYGEVLEDVPGALWTHTDIEVDRVEAPPELTRVVIGVDPAATSGEDADMTGIAVVGMGVDGHAYILADRTCHLTPHGWGTRVLTAFDEFGADRIIAEVNNGGEMVEYTLRTVGRDAGKTLPVRLVHASRGKRVRAEPVAALYEQHRVHHCRTVNGSPTDLGGLEDQMVTFLPEGNEKSPDRVDALVWALTELMLGHGGGAAYLEYLKGSARPEPREPVAVAVAIPTRCARRPDGHLWRDGQCMACGFNKN